MRAETLVKIFRLIMRDPAAAAEMRERRQEETRARPAGEPGGREQAGSVTITATASGRGRAYVAGRDQRIGG